MLDRAGPVLDRGPKYETGIFKVVRYFGGPGLDRGPDWSKAVRSASLVESRILLIWEGDLLWKTNLLLATAMSSSEDESSRQP